jgi:hypothetical protein
MARAAYRVKARQECGGSSALLEFFDDLLAAYALGFGNCAQNRVERADTKRIVVRNREAMMLRRWFGG